MATKQAIILVILVTIGCQDASGNRADDPLDEAKAAIVQEQDLQNIGGILNNLMQSDGAKELGDMLLNAASEKGGSQILQGLGAAMEMLQPRKQEETSVDPSMIFSMLSNLIGGDAQNNVMGYLPMFLQMANAFTGPEAEKRAERHKEHANFLPPIMEKVHLMFDHFMNTDIAKHLINTVGAEKFVKIFADSTGKYSYRKMIDMLENHSFRRHWLSLITTRIAKVIIYFSDGKTQKKYLTTFQHFVNSILKTQGYPKSVLLDFNRPVETISAIANQISKEFFNIKTDSKIYIKPAVHYIQELFSMAHKRGVVTVDHHQLSDKLADTINMEMIEPFARVNRAYKFGLKVPECNKYIMCLVNQEPSDEVPSLPGLRPMLSKTASLVLSWFLSSQHGSSYLELYNIIISEDNCQKYYMRKCNDFHVEEVKVTTEYVHNEL